MAGGETAGPKCHLCRGINGSIIAKAPARQRAGVFVWARVDRLEGEGPPEPTVLGSRQTTRRRATSRGMEPESKSRRGHHGLSGSSQCAELPTKRPIRAPHGSFEKVVTAWCRRVTPGRVEPTDSRIECRRDRKSQAALFVTAAAIVRSLVVLLVLLRRVGFEFVEAH